MIGFITGRENKMFVGLPDAIPAGQFGIVLPLGGHQFLLTGTAAAVRIVATLMEHQRVDEDAISDLEVERLGGQTILSVGTGRGSSDYITGHYLATAMLRRLMVVDLATRGTRTTRQRAA